ncbi:hypothetical protein K466DRAFT_602186 [Polyporus arcularius HHB13444]|uniref:F-box domain-containing protein n=1 Tax=Polyporus arcularius HHB13444 TaxID=1314778 RepID=A0A5C3PEE1_9APHY|nr:hypothetical protein K466DRAFT_602186 [Polyporus arcularius HHB13444]
MLSTTGSLPLEVLLMILDFSDTGVLSAWRRTCRAFQDRVHRILTHTIHAVISHYLLDPMHIVGLLRRWDAIITDHAAVAFLLRDLDVLTRELVISVHADDFDNLCAHLLRRYSLKPFPESAPSSDGPTVQLYRISESPSLWLRVRCITAYTTPPLKSPVAGLGCAEHTAAMNFVGADIYGCAYPSLTLRRRALLRLPWNRLQHWQSPALKDILLFMAKGRFTFSADPYTLLDERLTPIDFGPFRLPCLRSMYICDCRPRYFGDYGSLVDVFDLSRPHRPQLVHQLDMDTGRGIVSVRRIVAANQT